jgi:hypothetical protein
MHHLTSDSPGWAAGRSGTQRPPVSHACSEARSGTARRGWGSGRGEGDFRAEQQAVCVKAGPAAAQ